MAPNREYDGGRGVRTATFHTDRAISIPDDPRSPAMPDIRGYYGASVMRTASFTLTEPPQIKTTPGGQEWQASENMTAPTW